MAFPKKIRRSITVDERLYHWACINKTISETDALTRSRLEEARKTILEKNPELKKNKNWGIMLSPSGNFSHWTKSSLYIQAEDSPEKVQIDFDSIDFYPASPRMKFEYLDFLSITPSMVKMCIHYLNENKLWKTGLKIPNGSALFRKQVIRALQKDEKWMPEGLVDELDD